MSTLREGLSPGAGEAGSGSGTGLPVQQEGQRRRAGLTGFRGLISRHLLFCAALVLAVVPRAIAMLGYRPAVLFRLDTFDYLWDAVHLQPNPVNPSGYALFLALLRPFHSLALIAGLQHVMGLGIAVLVYAVLRSRGVSGWLATLAALPVLFDPGQLLIEQFVMADIVALLLMVASFAVLLVRRVPSVWRSVTAGLLMGASTIVRPTTLPLIVLVAVYLLVQHAGWRRALAALLAGAAPVAGYALWFSTAYGGFNLTNSNGLFLWSRTMSFANCAVIKPPADLQALCPTAQPGSLSQPVPAKRQLPKAYLWTHTAWMWQPPSAGIVPDTSAFTQANNARALRFAVLAIKAQPLAYARVIAHDVKQPFIGNNQLRFPVSQMVSSSLSTRDHTYAVAAIRAYTGTTAGVAPYLGYQFGVRLVPPYAALIKDYQRVIFFPGQLFGVVLAIGLVGIFLPRRRTSAAALLWLSAVIAIVLPIAEHEYTYRYVIPAVPLVCMAAALAFRDLSQDRQAVLGPAGTADPQLAEPPAENPPAERDSHAGPGGHLAQDGYPAQDSQPAQAGPTTAQAGQVPPGSQVQQTGQAAQDSQAATQADYPERGGRPEPAAG